MDLPASAQIRSLTLSNNRAIMEYELLKSIYSNNVGFIPGEKLITLHDYKHNNDNWTTTMEPKSSSKTSNKLDNTPFSYDDWYKNDIWYEREYEKIASEKEYNQALQEHILDQLTKSSHIPEEQTKQKVVMVGSHEVSAPLCELINELN